jgi:hypothetical protein
MNHVRAYGDPFGDDAPASQMRSFLRLLQGNGMRGAWSLDGMPAHDGDDGLPTVTVRDCDGEVAIPTLLPPAEVELLQRAADEAAPSTAPVVVFADESRLADAVRNAGFAWPQACVVVAARSGVTPADLLQRVRAELRWAGLENPPHAREELELAPWRALPKPAADGPLVCVATDGHDDGVDLAIAAWRRARTATTSTRSLRVVVAVDSPAVVENVWSALGDDAPHAEVLVAAFAPELARDAAAIVLPWRRVRDVRTLVHALASGRPVCASRFAATAPFLCPSASFAVGGRLVADAATGALVFAPEPRSLDKAIAAAVADPARAAAVGCRARAFVGAELTRGRPIAPPPPTVPAVAPPPTIVVEAAWHAGDEAAERAAALVRALSLRADVAVQCVPARRSRIDATALAVEAPEVAERLVRSPARADLWLAVGASTRAVRPACRTFVIGAVGLVDAAAADFAPLMTQECDLALVADAGLGAALRGADRRAETVLAWEAPAAAAAHLAGRAVAARRTNEPVAIPSAPPRVVANARVPATV